MGRSVPDSLLIPVETLNRELDGKLLLALLAADRGMRPILGSRTAIHDHLTSFPASIYLSKGVRTGNRVILGITERLGHVIVALDEEALIRQSDEALLMMFDEETFNRPRLLYAWGSSNAEVWRRYPGYRGAPVLEVGNPRVDMMTPRLRGYWEPEVARLRQRYGRFVLFSSNFSLVNHYIPEYVRFRFAAGASAEKAREFRGGIHGHKAAVFEAFQQLLPRIAAAIRPHALVIRPHPSENAQTWRDACAGLDNVHVVHQGPIAPWLIAASALLHNGCTSGVEAAILGTPAFAYRPVIADEFEPELPNALSIPCSDAEAVLTGVRRALSEDGLKAELGPAQLELLHHHISSLEGPLCCERILDSFTTHREALEAAPPAGPGRRLSGRTRQLLRRAARAVRTRRARSRSSSVYLSHKFPGIEAAEVERRIARFRAVLPGLPPARARQLRRDIFAIEGA